LFTPNENFFLLRHGTMEDKKILFSEYFKAKPISEISFVDFLYFCRDKNKIFIIDEKRHYVQAYKEGLAKAKKKKNEKEIEIILEKFKVSVLYYVSNDGFHCLMIYMCCTKHFIELNGSFYYAIGMVPVVLLDVLRNIL